MVLNKTQVVLLLTFLFHLTGFSARAQYRLHQSFTGLDALQGQGWTSTGTQLLRSNANGYAAQGRGSAKFDFYHARPGEVDSFLSPVFTPAVTGDSLIFDHAHMMRESGAGDKDSLQIYYSTNGGNTYQLLVSYIADPVVSPISLSTIPQPGAGAGVPFEPNASAHWATKGVALPLGTNSICFVFYASGGDNLYLDNILVGTMPAACFGSPDALNVTGSATLCIGEEFSFTPAAYEWNPTLTYQWEFSPDDGITPWANVRNETSPELLASFFGPGYYRVKTTCTLSTLEAASASFFVTQDSSYNCYCKDSLGGSCRTGNGRPVITQVRFPAGYLNNPSLCDGDETHAYTAFPVSPLTTDTLRGATLANQIEITHSEAHANVYMWIDHNRNGVYEKIEFYRLGLILVPGTHLYHFDMPLHVDSGLTGMRIRIVDAFLTLDSADACTFKDGGETEDYLMMMEKAVLCAGTPVAGTLSDVAIKKCAADRVTISAYGTSIGYGISYQWEESNDNGITDPFRDVVDGDGITSVNFEPVPKLDTMYYRLKIKCSNSTDSVYSDTVRVITDAFYQCYCKSSLGGAACAPDNPYISYVGITGKLIDNPSSCSANSMSYTNYAFEPNAFDTLQKGSVIEIKVKTEIARTAVVAWIDYDHSGEFDFHEGFILGNYNTAGDTVKGFIPVPDNSGVLTGLTALRVRTSSAQDMMNEGFPCTTFRTGETEDYIIYIKDGQPCDGAPAAGVYPDTINACAGSEPSIRAVGVTYAQGISFQWEESDDNGVFDNWTDVLTGTGADSEHLKAAPVTQTIWYRLKVTCTNTSMVTYGDPVLVNVQPVYACNCYDNLGGAGAGACENGNYITNVNIAGTAIDNRSFCMPDLRDNNYVRYQPSANTFDTLVIGQLYKLAVVTGSTTGDRVVAWIDYNGNGVFEANEHIAVSALARAGIADSVSFIIPPAGYTGYASMRIRIDCEFCSSLDPADACTPVMQGETEDYLVYIKAPEPCAGVPEAGTVSSSQVVCAGGYFALETRGASVLNGIKYQWEESDDEGVNDPWTAIDTTSGDTTTFVALIATSEKYYRMKVTCTNSGMEATSNTTRIIFDSAYSCYTPGADLGGGGCAFDEHIARVNIRGTTLDNFSGCQKDPFSGTYAKYPPAGAATATLTQGRIYEIEVLPQGFGYQAFGAWVDFNRNGDFEVSEFIQMGSGGSGFGEIHVPMNAVPGLTGMRVRTRFDNWAGTGSINGSDVTTPFTSGETEDYVIMIEELKQAAGITSTTAGNSITLNWVRGTGDSTMVLAKPETFTLTEPSDGIMYRADSRWDTFGGDSTANGNRIVYMGVDTFVTVTGLDQYTNYEFFIYESVNYGSFRYYLKPGASIVAGTLPVSWLSFDAYHTQGKEAMLEWSTASEKNNKGFYVQYSTDGIRFTDIGFVNGRNTSSVSKYTFRDAQAFAFAKLVYYRLRQIDFDGTTAYSKTVSVNTEQENAGIIISPNPFTNKVSISLKQFVAGDHCDIELFNLLGQTIRKKHIVMDVSGRAEMQDLEELENGMYILQVRRAGVVESFRLLKQ